MYNLETSLARWWIPRKVNPACLDENIITEMSEMSEDSKQFFSLP